MRLVDGWLVGEILRTVYIICAHGSLLCRLHSLALRKKRGMSRMPYLLVDSGSAWGCCSPNQVPCMLRSMHNPCYLLIRPGAHAHIHATPTCKNAFLMIFCRLVSVAPLWRCCDERWPAADMWDVSCAARRLPQQRQHMRARRSKTLGACQEMQSKVIIVK